MAKKKKATKKSDDAKRLAKRIADKAEKSRLRRLEENKSRPRKRNVLY